MLAVHLEKGKVSVRNAPRPAPRQGFALIRLLYGGICNTDIELLRGYYGFRGTPGHEFVGEVVAGSRALMGRKVVGEINVNCSRCQCGAIRTAGPLDLNSGATRWLDRCGKRAKPE